MLAREIPMTDSRALLLYYIISIPDRLIDEVLGHDSGDKVPMEKVVMLIWQFRDDPQVVKFMTRFVAKVREGKSAVVLLFYCFIVLLFYCFGRRLGYPAPSLSRT
jgi:hypothetical protein